MRKHQLLSNRGAGVRGMVTEGWERRKFGFCKINSVLFWQQIIHKWPAKQQPVPSLLPCLLLCLFPSLFPFLRNCKNQTNGFVMRFFEGKRNLDGNKYLLFIKDIYKWIYSRKRCLFPCSHFLFPFSMEATRTIGPPHLPRHGLKPEGVTSAIPREKKRPIRLQTQSGKSVWDGGRR